MATIQFSDHNEVKVQRHPGCVIAETIHDTHYKKNNSPVTRPLLLITYRIIYTNKYGNVHSNDMAVLSTIA